MALGSRYKYTAAAVPPKHFLKLFSFFFATTLRGASCYDTLVGGWRRALTGARRSAPRRRRMRGRCFRKHECLPTASWSSLLGAGKGRLFLGGAIFVKSSRIEYITTGSGQNMRNVDPLKWGFWAGGLESGCGCKTHAELARLTRRGGAIIT